MEFWWLAVFEQFTSIEVLQRPADESESPTSSRQAVAQKWNKTGTAMLAPGRTTEDLVKDIVKGCKRSGDVPEDALLINLVMLPNRPFGNVE